MNKASAVYFHIAHIVLIVLGQRERENSRSSVFLLTDLIAAIGDEKSGWTSRFANVSSEQIWVIFTRLKLWIAVARHNFKRVKIKKKR